MTAGGEGRDNDSGRGSWMEGNLSDQRSFKDRQVTNGACP